MSEQTRQHIEQIIKELDYRPNRQAQFLKSKNSSLIGIAVGDISNFYTSLLIKGILNRLKSTNYRSLIMDSDLSRSLEKKNIEKLVDEQIDGMIIQPIGATSESYKEIREDFPVVQIDRFVEPLIWPAVVSDNFQKSKELTQLIIDKGYQRIIVVSPPLINSTPRIARYEGLIDAIRNTNVEIKEIIAPEAKNLNSDLNHLKEITELLKDDIKTAIYTFNGPLLYESLGFLKEKQLRIPTDVGIAGYDDESFGELMGPGITAIEQNLVEIGFQAMDKLLQIIETQKLKLEITTVESKLVERKSL
ncbi:Transcriptional regulator KdgR KDG operon repressor [Lactococcus lactis subsp. lactis]|nr:Transcriptional regulator KdgR KDG operon repressor [Lactococcus lactis subsp. lactis]